MPTSIDVARWMQDKVTERRELFQQDAAAGIETTFGPEFVYENERGVSCISKAVLKEFRKLTEDTVIWERR